MHPQAERLKEEAVSRGRAALRVLEPHREVLFFSGGFLFDAATLNRIDAWLDLAMQSGYLLALTLLLWLQYRRARERWSPAGYFAKVWAFNLDARQFLFGGLLSAYLIFYFKSGVHGKSLLFFALVAVLLVYNEFPQAKRWGPSLRLALYAFCLASYLIYLVPVLLGRMGDWVFTLSLALSALGAGGLAAALSWDEAERKAVFKRLVLAPGVVLAGLTLFYFLRWIPPVPLSLKHIGIYHAVEHGEGGYTLSFEKGPWYALFRNDDRPFYARERDRIYCFVRIFAPVRFRHQVSLRWLQKDSDGVWVSRDRIPLPIRGGRAEGYRGYAYKGVYSPGPWRVDVETEDGRVIGRARFEVRPGEGAPEFERITM